MNGAATQIAAREFEGDFFRLPKPIQELVQKKIDAMSLRLPTFPHYRMTGSDKYRLRVGGYPPTGCATWAGDDKLPHDRNRPE
jgi:hypothetical protein